MLRVQGGGVPLRHVYLVLIEELIRTPGQVVYLDALFDKDQKAGAAFHELQVLIRNSPPS